MRPHGRSLAAEETIRAPNHQLAQHRSWARAMAVTAQKLDLSSLGAPIQRRSGSGMWRCDRSRPADGW